MKRLVLAALLAALPMGLNAQHGSSASGRDAFIP